MRRVRNSNKTSRGAREAAQAQAARLQEAAEADKEKISEWWAGMQKSWSDHVAGIRRNVDAKRAELETKAAQRDADIAEKDATFAVRFALAAVEEAEYAVLYAHVGADGRRQPGREIGLTRLRLMPSSEAVDACRRSPNGASREGCLERTTTS